MLSCNLHRTELGLGAMSAQGTIRSDLPAVRQDANPGGLALRLAFDVQTASGLNSGEQRSVDETAKAHIIAWPRSLHARGDNVERICSSPKAEASCRIYACTLWGKSERFRFGGRGTWVPRHSWSLYLEVPLNTIVLVYDSPLFDNQLQAGGCLR